MRLNRGELMTTRKRASRALVGLIAAGTAVGPLVVDAAFPGTALIDEEFRDSLANKFMGVEVNILMGSLCLSVLGASLVLGRRGG
jgi:hypothetical protein